MPSPAKPSTRRCSRASAKAARGRRRALCEHPDLTDVAELAVQWRAAGGAADALAASLAAARAANEMYA